MLSEPNRSLSKHFNPTDDYLCYKEPKSPFILIFSELFTVLLKLRTNGNIEKRGALFWTGRTSTSSLRSHTDPFAFSAVLPRLSEQKVSI